MYTEDDIPILKESAKESRAKGDVDLAIQNYKQILEIDPNLADIHNNLANILKAQGCTNDAITHYHQAIQLSPGLAAPYNNLGNLLQELGQIDDAIKAFDSAIDICPDFSEAYQNLGNAYLLQSDLKSAEQAYNRALQLKPSVHLQFRLATLIPPIYKSESEVGLIRRQVKERLDELLRINVKIDPLKDVIQPPFYLSYQGENDRNPHELIARLCGDSSEVSSGLQRKINPINRRIKIAFISSYFTAHTVGEMVKGLIAHLSHEKFEITVFSLSNSFDETTKFIQNNCEHFIQLSSDLLQAIEKIKTAEMDILYYTDIGMNPSTYALASIRLAPIQCVTWGHPITSGLSTIDSFISSRDLESESSDDHYTEKLVLLNTLGLFLYRTDMPQSSKQICDYGLPSDANLYGCLQSLFKLLPEFDKTLGDILRKDPKGVLVLCEGPVANWGQILRKRFQESIPDVASRIYFLKRQTFDDYLRLVQLMDVLLVPPQFGGGRTSWEAFSLGVPIVTQPSEFLRGRITFAMYKRLGIDDCIAHSEAEYVDTAVRLGTEPSYRQFVSDKILDRLLRLFEDIEAVRELERFFVAAVIQKYNEPS